MPRPRCRRRAARGPPHPELIAPRPSPRPRPGARARHSGSSDRPPHFAACRRRPSTRSRARPGVPAAPRAWSRAASHPAPRRHRRPPSDIAGHERQQRPGADERDAATNRYTLAFQRDLRPAEREHPGVVQPGKGRMRSIAPVASTSRSKGAARSRRTEQINRVFEDIPGERRGSVVHVVAEIGDKPMQGARLAGLQAIERLRRSVRASRRLTVDLAARTRRSSTSTGLSPALASASTARNPAAPPPITAMRGSSLTERRFRSGHAFRVRPESCRL